MLIKGREFQQAPAIPESKWKATLFDGTVVEFLGIRENRSKESLWWGPDGSLIDYIPNYDTEPIDRFFKLRTIYEMAWRVTPSRGFPYTLEGCTDMHDVHSFIDRYGNVFYSGYFVDGFYFEPSRKATTLKIGYGSPDWKTALEIKDKEGEIKFLDKYRVMLKPPEIKKGEIFIHCYMEFSTLMNYVTDFAIVVNDGSATQTISLDQVKYRYRYLDRVDRGGLTQTVYRIKDMDISQIESVCFRYRPYGAIFKNISLVPGENQGFEIEVIEADEK